MENSEMIRICDCTLRQGEKSPELSFREKIELCRLIDKLGVSAIDLCPIRQKKTDRLLVKSIASAVKNAAVAVPVDLMDEESVRITWEALKEAGMQAADGQRRTDCPRRHAQRSGLPCETAFSSH